MLDGGAVSEDDDVTSNRSVRQMEERIREFERHGLGPVSPDTQAVAR
jgi:hypothetical protein